MRGFMKTFLEWLELNESYEKERRELHKMMEKAGFRYLGVGGANEDKWEKDGAPVSTSTKPKSPRFIFGKAQTEWKKSKLRMAERKGNSEQ